MEKKQQEVCMVWKYTIAAAGVLAVSYIIAATARTHHESDCIDARGGVVMKGNEPLMEVNDTGGPGLRKAMFGAGCFWGVEAAFRKVKGVVDTAVGYSGGWTKDPSYEDVCSGRTGHTEVVLVTYDTAKVSYDELLNAFWRMHDSTQVDRQGPDIGRQYRSVIFYFDDEQRQIAEAAKVKLEESGQYSKPVATRIERAGDFWRAEEYHQRYYEKRGIAGCRL